MTALFPPSSRPTGLSVLAASAAIRFPVTVLPVNMTLATMWCATSAAPATAPYPGTILTTPAGIPASAMSLPRYMTERHACSAGFSTTVLPAAIAGTKVKEGDLVLISFPSGTRGPPPNHHVLLVDQEGMIDLTAPSFGSSDGTFKAIQRGDEVHFDLGFEERRKKTAVYTNKTVTVDVHSLGPEAILPKNGM